MNRYDRDYEARFRGPRGYDHSFRTERPRPHLRYEPQMEQGGRDRYDRYQRGPRRHPAYDRDFGPRGQGAMGGIWDPMYGPFRLDRGISNFGAGRPHFFTAYGGGEQTGNSGRGW